MPTSTLAQDLFDELSALPTIDAHEHLPPEEERVARQVDFFTLFEHYCKGDLISAGATEDDMSFWADRDKPLDERWQRFEPFLSAIRTGSYARSALVVVRDLLGFDDLNGDTYEAVSAALQEGNTPGLYERIIKERCNIVACLQCWQLGNPHPDYFYHLAPGPEVVDTLSREKIEEQAKRHGIEVGDLDGLLDCMTKQVEAWKADPMVVGIKSAHAYGRSIAFANTPRADAERLLAKLLADEDVPSPEQTTALQDFLMWELVARAEACDLPMVFHTGLQAGNSNRLTNANPLHLEPLLQAFPNVPFDLFHAGMPWVREIGVLAKYFPNVYLNMAWTHIISPTQSRSALSEWLDMVPNTKIFGFGGDYAIVEKIYGHVTLARQDIAAVLAEKIEEGAFTRADASMVAKRLMFDNPNEFYRLGLE